MGLIVHNSPFAATVLAGYSGYPTFANTYISGAATTSGYVTNVGNTAFSLLTAPPQGENALRADHLEVEWLRRRVHEITDLVAV